MDGRLYCTRGTPCSSATPTAVRGRSPQHDLESLPRRVLSSRFGRSWCCDTAFSWLSLARPLRSGTSMFTMQFMIVYKHPCGASSISLRCSQAHLQGAAAGHFARSRSCNPQRSLHHHQYIQLSSAYHLNIISISSYHHHSNDQSYNAVPHSRTWNRKTQTLLNF